MIECVKFPFVFWSAVLILSTYTTSGEAPQVDMSIKKSKKWYQRSGHLKMFTDFPSDWPIRMMQASSIPTL